MRSLLIFILFYLVISCAAARIAGEGAGVAGGAAVGSLAGPIGAGVGGAVAYLGIKAATGDSLQGRVNNAGIRYAPPTAGALFSRFWVWLTAAAIILAVLRFDKIPSRIRAFWLKPFKPGGPNDPA